ncbi:sigma 54-interacting transcriptional regulator [Aquincola sp. MAHUQ-54]|uniref:Sigma 54-interacting transcriptional regulator n=1 Tax=Aquincola agrisoli TaxID=3119538 RepID=A0AAW9QHN7_9BURK
MVDNRLLCVIARGVASPARLLESIGWEVCAISDSRLLPEASARGRCRVGLVIGRGLDDAACAELDALLRDHAGIEWVGAFDAASLSLPACRDLIFEHLFDHHSLPLDMERLRVTLGHAHGRGLLRQGRTQPARHDNSPLIGCSDARAQLLQQVRRIAKVDAPVLISGESGSGKELAARAIHEGSARAAGPLVTVNCGAIQPTLVQSELFGYVKGAFTGAVRDKRGFIEAANGGTIFLDEIGDLPLDMQINLLRFLQEGTVNRVGSTQPMPVDVRVIAATHINVEQAVAAGKFREDLFYRLNVLSLHVPPLRERRRDVAVLAQHFFEKFSTEKQASVKGFSQRAMRAMDAYAWPGNVRELINRVRRAMVMSDGRLITAADLGLPESEVRKPPERLDASRMRAEREAIQAALQQAGNNVSHAARELGVSRITLYRLMAKHGLAH